MHTTPQTSWRGWLKSPTGKALLVLAGIAAATGLAEHWAHAAPYLPWLVVLACPLMHVFMHRGHGHGARSTPENEAKSEGASQDPEHP